MDIIQDIKAITILFVFIDSSCIGYISDISPIKKSKKGTKIFDFTLETDKDVKRVVSFTPEKHKLLSSLSGTDNACEINKTKISATNDILITDSSTVKKVDSTFKKRGSTMVLQTIEMINNEAPLFQIVSTCGLVMA